MVLQFTQTLLHTVYAIHPCVNYEAAKREQILDFPPSQRKRREIHAEIHCARIDPRLSRIFRRTADIDKPAYLVNQARYQLLLLHTVTRCPPNSRHVREKANAFERNAKQ